MSNWLGKCLCLVAALGVLDGHLMLVQSWAWLSMLQERTPEMGVTEALDKTFSGAAPCPMCRKLQEERREKEEESPVPEIQPLAKYLPAGEVDRVVIYPPVLAYETRAARCAYLPQTRIEAPPSPPPRLFL